MTKESNLIKMITAAFFAALLLLGIANIADYVADHIRQKDIDHEFALSFDELESEYASRIWKHRELVDLNGLLAKALNMQGLYSDMGMYVTDNDYIVSASAYTTTDYEVDEIVALRDYLEANGVELLYVNEPTKYVDDELLMREFGVETYSNRNMDLFLERIRAAGVNAIDLRDNIEEDGLDVSELFYRTDHHWTVPTGLWATKIMAEGLNEYCGYNIDTSVFEEEDFVRMDWKRCWLGEQGRKMARTRVGLDDYTELKPSFKTDYTFKKADGTTYDGTFDDFIDESVYDIDRNVYESDSWHYSYDRIDCINNNIESGKILILGDSYDHVTQPFLSLQVHEVDSLIPRAYHEDCSLMDYIVKNGYDTVIVAYAQFMVGAHDDPSSENYNMFTFD